MANGNEYEILRGPFRGWIHRTIEAESDSTPFELVPAREAAIIEIGYMDITVKGAGGKYEIKDEDGFSVKGPQLIFADGDGTIMASDGTEGYRTKVHKKAVQLIRGAAAEARGELCYKYNSSPGIA